MIPHFILFRQFAIIKVLIIIASLIVAAILTIPFPLFISIIITLFIGIFWRGPKKRIWWETKDSRHSRRQAVGTCCLKRIISLHSIRGIKIPFLIRAAIIIIRVHSEPNDNKSDEYDEAPNPS